MIHLKVCTLKKCLVPPKSNPWGYMYPQINLLVGMLINYVVNRANRLVGLIKRSFKSLDRDSFLTLYKSLVRSILDYGGSVYDPYTKKNIQLIENIQRISPTEKISGIPLEFYWNSSGIKGTFFHWKRAVPPEFPLDSSRNSTGSVEIPLDSVEIPLNSSRIPLDSSGIPLDSSGNSIGIPLYSSGNSIGFQ